MVDGPRWRPKPTGLHWLPCPTLEHGTWNIEALMMRCLTVSTGMLISKEKKNVGHYKIKK